MGRGLLAAMGSGGDVAVLGRNGFLALSGIGAPFGASQVELWVAKFPAAVWTTPGYIILEEFHGAAAHRALHIVYVSAAPLAPVLAGALHVTVPSSPEQKIEII